MKMLEAEIKNGENEWMEFKRELPKRDIRFLKTVVAFANGKGGKIIIGIDDATHEILGVEDESRSLLQDGITNMISDSCSPQIYPTYDWVNIQGKNVLIVEIPEGSNCPYFITKEGVHGGTYVRVDATTRKAEPEKIQELQMYGKRVSYDSIVPKKTEPATREEIATLCKLFNDNADETQREVTATQLLNWGYLTRKGDEYIPTVAFQLLVGRSTFRFSGVQCARFDGNTQVSYMDRKTFGDSLYDQFSATMNFLKTHLTRKTTITGAFRDDQYELPLAALREAVANAIIHRNYLVHGMIKVSIFDNRVEISSPGTLYANLSKKEMFQGISRLRNPLLADGFHRLKLVEKWGGGVRRILELCKEAGLAVPSYDIREDSVSVTFKRQSLGRNKGAHLSKPSRHASSDQIRQAIVRLIKKSPDISRQQIAVALNLSPSNARYHLGILCDEGIIERVGSRRGGVWRVRTKE